MVRNASTSPEYVHRAHDMDAGTTYACRLNAVRSAGFPSAPPLQPAERGVTPHTKNSISMGFRAWWSRRRGKNQVDSLDRSDRPPRRDSEVQDSSGKTISGALPSCPTFPLARLPSRLVVDVDFTKDAGGKVPVCQLVHLVVDTVTIRDLDLTGLPAGRKRAAERNALKSFCTVSIGKQTYVTPDRKLTTFDDEEGEGGGGGEGAGGQGKGAVSAVVRHGCGATFVVSDQGAKKLRVGLYCRGRLDGALKNRFIGYSMVDLDELVRSAIADDRAVTVEGANEHGKLPSYLYEADVDIVSPSGDVVVGELKIKARAASVVKLEEQLWVKLLTIGDWSDSDGLDFEEFVCVMEAFGSDVGENELFDVFERARGLSADTDATRLDVVSIARALSTESTPGVHFSRYVPFCPVDGAVFSTDPAAGASNILYCWLALSESIGDAGGEMKAGYLTESEASRAWALRLTEWNGFYHRRKKKGKPSKQLGGLRVGASAHSILLFDRSTKQIIEEIVSPLIIMAMRTLYQSKIGRRFLRNSGFLARMCEMSVSEGAYRDSELSARDIPHFIESFKGQLDMSVAEKPASEYKTFNEFFARKLRPGVRPISGDTDDVLVSAADCRLHVYESVDDATRFWVKGRNYSTAGLLADETLAAEFQGGSMAIFRLAPQDYHRYHAPVAGQVISITDVPGHLLTVNPIAVNCVHADVFTVNKRAVMVIETPNFGKVAFVAIGATLVGSIVWTAKPGDVIERGTELGYFKFGGSTCIALFQKDVVTWDKDIASNSLRSLETLVEMGVRIGMHAEGKEQLSPIDTKIQVDALHAADAAAADAGVMSIEERMVSMRSARIDLEEGLKTVVDRGY